MKPIKLALAALAATFTLSSAHADIKQHRLMIQGGLPAMLVFVGTETPISGSTPPNNHKLVQLSWDKSDSADTYEDYYFCEQTKQNQPVNQMTCYAEFDEKGPNYQLFQNDPGMDK